MVLKFPLSFLKDRGTDSFLEKKKEIKVLSSILIQIYAHTHLHMHTYIKKSIKILNLEIDYGGEDGLVVTICFDLHEAGALTW